jgi:hypothetical protein
LCCRNSDGVREWCQLFLDFTLIEFGERWNLSIGSWIFCKNYHSVNDRNNAIVLKQ